jgi:hypothetical protein
MTQLLSVYTSHYPCPSLVKYPKLSLGYNLDLCHILFRLLSLRCVYYLFAYSLLLHHIIIDNPNVSHFYPIRFIFSSPQSISHKLP